MLRPESPALDLATRRSIVDGNRDLTARSSASSAGPLTQPGDRGTGLGSRRRGLPYPAITRNRGRLTGEDR